MAKATALSKMGLCSAVLRLHPIFSLSLSIDKLSFVMSSSMIGLGLNEIHKQRGFMASLNGGDNLLNISRMKESIKLLDISCMPIPWKVFFYLCKKRLTILLTAMLYMMEYVRTHRRQQKNESETTQN